MKANKDTLIILSPGFAADEAATTCLDAQQSLLLAVNKLIPSLKIIIVAFANSPANKNHNWHSNQVITFNGKKRGNLFSLNRCLKVWQTLSHLRKENCIIGFLSFGLGEWALMGGYFSRLHHYKHFTWLSAEDTMKKNRYVKWISPAANTLVAMSDSICHSFLVTHGIKPAYSITPGIDPEIYPKMHTGKDIDILAVGSFAPLHHYTIFIEIIALLHQQIPCLSVVLCGEGPEKENLQKLINQSGLKDTVTIGWERPCDEVLQFMQRSKILLHTAANDSLCKVCMESLYAGVHVVSFCTPMNAWIRHWHIVETKEDMLQETLQLLALEKPDDTPVLAYDIKDAARSILQLFTD